jgi:hypothetical protein
MLRRAALLAGLVLLCCTGRSQQAQMSGKDIVAQAVRVELAANAADHTHWLYYESDKKPGSGTVQWVAQTTFGELARVLEKDGHPLSIVEQRSSMDTFIRDNSAQSKQRKGAQDDDRQATQMLNMLPEAFTWTITGHQDGTTTLHFKPSPNFHPPTWESRVFAAMEGDMTVHDAQHRIVSLKGTMTSQVKFGWGLFGAIEPGGWFQVERREIAKGMWQITETHVHIRGHALIFKSISEQEDDVKSRFEQLPGNITFTQAEEKLLIQGNSSQLLSLR